MFARLCSLVIVAQLSSVAFAALGNEGGGGGSVVVCPDSSSLELTDLNEARAKDPRLAESFKLLRRLNEGEVQAYFADQLATVLLKSQNPAERNHAEQVDEVKNLLIDLYQHVTFGKPADPKDSGKLNLTSPRCQEARVAVNQGFDVYLSVVGVDFTSRYVQVVQNLWENMPMFDRYALLVHELLYAITEGRVSISQMDPKIKSRTSAEIRPLVGVIASGHASKMPSVLEAMPRTGFAAGEIHDCWAGSAAARRDDSSWDRMHFEIIEGVQPGSSQIVLTTAWGVPVFAPNVADVAIDKNSLYMAGSDLKSRNENLSTPLGIVRNLNLGSSGHDFQLKRTRFAVKFHLGPAVYGPGPQETDEQAVYFTLVDVSKSGKAATVFDGPISCNRPSVP